MLVHIFLPIVTQKLTKHFSNIISNKLLSGCSSNFGNNQRFKLNVEPSSTPVKDIELLCCLIGRLLFTGEITRPDVQACVIYVLTMIKLPTNYYKDRNLNTDILFVKKTHMFVLSSAED